MSNDEHRFRALYDEHFTALTRYVVRRVGTPTDAGDVVAETFLVLWRKLDQAPAGRELPWLYGVARRVLANHRRSAQRRDQLIGKLSDQISIAAQDSERGRDFVRDEVQAVRGAMDRLSPDDQEVLRLVAWEELSREEIATALGCSRATARVRLHRARARLRTQLQARSVDQISAAQDCQNPGHKAQTEEARP